MSTSEIAAKYGIDEEQVLQYKDSFAIFDKNGDGSISIREFEQVLKSLGQTVDAGNITAMLKEVDADGSGEIDFGEFVGLMIKKNTRDSLKATFDTFDTDHSGSITKDELKAALKAMGSDPTDAEVDAMIKEADTDKNNEVDFEEFCKMMGSQQQ